MRKIIVLCATVIMVASCVGCSEDYDKMSGHERFEITYYAPDGSKECFYVKDYFFVDNTVFGKTVEGDRVQIPKDKSTIREMSNEERMFH